MILIKSAPILLIFSLLFLLLSGVIILTWGKRLPAKGEWILWIGLLGLLSVIGLVAGITSNIQFQNKIGLTGWIWPRADVGALMVGIFQDPIGLATTTLFVLVTSATLLSRNFFPDEPHLERTFAALAFSTVGVTLAWNSLTPWLVLAGIVLTLFGGFMSYGSRWQSSVEANAAIKFMRVRSAGFLLAFFGACVLATSRTALLFDQPNVWIAQTGDFESTWLGSIILVIGLFIQMQPFPFLGWVVSPSESYNPTRTLLTQICPAWAAFALLLRLESHFQHLGLFPGFGWVALGCSAFTVLSGLFQSNWNSALRVWLASGFSLSVAMLAFSGPLSGFGMMIGLSLGALVISAVGVELQKDSPKEAHRTKTAPQKRGVLHKILGTLGMMASTGGLGFVSATSGIRWITQGGALAGEVPFFLLILFLFSCLGWTLVWSLLRSKKAANISWVSLILPCLGVILSLGVVWTGAVTGDVFLNVPDHLGISLFEEFFGTSASAALASETFFTASGFYWGMYLLAILTSYWISGRRENHLVMFASGSPRLTKFLTRGYDVDVAIGSFVRTLASLGKAIEAFVDYRIWSDWIPGSLSFGIKSFSNFLSRLDVKISSSLGRGLGVLVDVPTRVFQFIQTGDLRWYLIFVFGSSFALLLHFLFFLKR